MPAIHRQTWRKALPHIDFDQLPAPDQYISKISSSVHASSALEQDQQEDRKPASLILKKSKASMEESQSAQKKGRTFHWDSGMLDWSAPPARPIRIASETLQRHEAPPPSAPPMRIATQSSQRKTVAARTDSRPVQDEEDWHSRIRAEGLLPLSAYSKESLHRDASCEATADMARQGKRDTALSRGQRIGPELSHTVEFFNDCLNSTHQQYSAPDSGLYETRAIANPEERGRTAPDEDDPENAPQEYEGGDQTAPASDYGAAQWAQLGDALQSTYQYDQAVDHVEPLHCHPQVQKPEYQYAEVTVCEALPRDQQYGDLNQDGDQDDLAIYPAYESNEGLPNLGLATWQEQYPTLHYQDVSEFEELQWEEQIYDGAREWEAAYSNDLLQEYDQTVSDEAQDDNMYEGGDYSVTIVDAGWADDQEFSYREPLPTRNQSSKTASAPDPEYVGAGLELRVAAEQLRDTLNNSPVFSAAARKDPATQRTSRPLVEPASLDELLDRLPKPIKLEDQSRKRKAPQSEPSPRGDWFDDPLSENPAWFTASPPKLDPDQPTARVLANFGMARDRTLLRALQSVDFELVERESAIQGADLVLSPGIGIIMSNLASLGGERDNLSTQLDIAVRHFPRVIIVFALVAYSAWQRKDDGSPLEVDQMTDNVTRGLSNLKTRIKYYSPGIDGVLGKAEMVFAKEGAGQVARMLRSLYDQELNEAAKNMQDREVIDFTNRAWLSDDAGPEEETLVSRHQVNAFTAQYILRIFGGLKDFYAHPHETIREFLVSVLGKGTTDRLLIPPPNPQLRPR